MSKEPFCERGVVSRISRPTHHPSMIGGYLKPALFNTPDLGGPGG